MTENLTNESLSNICKSSFELAHYAIELSRYFIESGREAQLKDILREIKKHPDPEKYLDELRTIDTIEKRTKPKEVTPYE
ncbi:MAG: hypothetical protein JSS30_03030 [Verrucomicrobia bacterium]|nr:hypothetical protein [Verrucomicrobiota bacterium]